MTVALLDTNVILDLLLDRAPFSATASEIWDACRAGRVSGHISAITPPTVYYVGRRAVGEAAARLVLLDMLALLTVCPVDAEVLTVALTLPMTDYEDAVQYASAAAAGVEAIVTRDPAGFRGGSLPVYSTGDFLAQLPALDVEP